MAAARAMDHLSAGELTPRTPPTTAVVARPEDRVPTGQDSPDPSAPTISAATGTRPPIVWTGLRNLPGAALAGVARSLLIVLALFGLAVAFVAIQDRFDRTDPRLALAPIDSDLVEFV